MTEYQLNLLIEYIDAVLRYQDRANAHTWVAMQDTERALRNSAVKPSTVAVAYTPTSDWK